MANLLELGAKIEELEELKDLVETEDDFKILEKRIVMYKIRVLKLKKQRIMNASTRNVAVEALKNLEEQLAELTGETNG